MLHLLTMSHLIFRPLPPIGHHRSSEILYGVGMYRGEFEKDTVWEGVVISVVSGPRQHPKTMIDP